MHGDVEAVARAHLDAVLAGDPAAMAADYADHAVLIRAGERHQGRSAIEAYFATVPERLGAARVVFDDLVIRGDTAIFAWHLEGADAQVSGTDTCVIEDGRIVSQVVALDGTDF